MARRIRCNTCGKYGLVWKQTAKGWRLAWPKNGKLHMCKAGKAWAEDKAPNTQAEMIERGWLQPLEPSAIFTGQANPVGIPTNEEVQPNGSTGHPGSAEVAATNCDHLLRPTHNVVAVDAVRTLDTRCEASSVRTHLSPSYHFKPRLVSIRAIDSGIDCWLCKNVVDGVVFDAIAIDPEEAYRRMRSNVAHFEGDNGFPRYDACRVSPVEDADRKANRFFLAWVVSLVVLPIGLAILEYVRTHSG